MDFTELALDLSSLTSTDVAIPSGALSEGTQYYWRVRASDPLRTSDWSTIFNFTTLTTPLALPVLQAPANNSTNLDPTSVILDWSDVSEATSYEIQLSGNSGFSPVETFTSNTSTYTLDQTVLDYESQYFWRVKALNSTKQSDFTAGWSFSTMQAALPVPSLIAPANGATNVSITPSLDWSNIAGATSYGLQVATDNAFTNLTIDASGLDESMYTVLSGTLNFNTTYYWRANASDGSRTSEWSTVRNFTTEIDVSVELYNSGIPETFALLQNYPNPFNPSTNIRFALPEASEVRVVVVDLLGREVEELYNGSRPAGFFQITWDASKISSGTYIYRIDAKSETGEQFSQMKKMMFVK
jgi:hypothetical protein